MISSHDLEDLGIPWCFRQNSHNFALQHLPFIINLDDASGPGTHWVAAYLHEGTLYYADPFGTILNGWPPKEISSWPAVVNGIAFQRPSTQLCGYYAIRFVIAMRTIDRKLSQKDFEALLYTSLL